MPSGVVDTKVVNRKWKYDQQWDLIELPNGDRIVYIEVPGAPPSPKHRYHHTYWDAMGDDINWEPGKHQIDGCSSLSKAYDWDSGRLLAWKERVTCEGVAALYSEQLAQDWDMSDDEWLRSGNTIQAALREAKKSADDIRDKKGVTGTNVHKVLEALAGVGEWPALNAMPPEEQLYAKAVMRWWEEKRPKALNAEQYVYSKTHDFAGHFDLRWEDPETGWVTLTDLKTSGFIGPAYHVQLQLYAIAALECGVGHVDELTVLKVKDDGTYEEVPCRATEADALNAIATYRGTKRIERAAA